MAKDDDAWRRFREREDEKEKGEDAPSLRDKRLATGLSPTPGPLPTNTQDIDKLVQQIEPLIEQVNNLYGMFFSGVEKRPPQEKRRLLDAMVMQLTNAPKPNPGVQFRSQTIIQRHQTHRDRWEKMMKDFEDGKLRR